MSKSHKHHNRDKPWPAAQPAGGGTIPGASDLGFAEVERWLAQGNSKAALELAKEIHKRAGTAASEALLVKAYGARIRSLLKSGLAVEAQALLDLVKQRYPSAKSALGEVAVAVAAGRHSLDDLLSHLNDPGLGAERRAEIEATVRRELTDLNALARSPALPAEHPLRAGAIRLQTSWEAVTAGPVEDDSLELPEISRRSPLAPWKMLVRAVASFYRADDAACERWLQLIDVESAPARLVPAIRAMIARDAPPGLKAATLSLATQVAGKTGSLRWALQALDTAFPSRKRNQIIPAIQQAVAACRAASPDLLVRLCQHIAVRAQETSIQYNEIQRALGGGPRQDAYFWRLAARLAEGQHTIHCVPACHSWDQFRRHAVQEGWFPADSPEVAAIYLHMVDILDHIPREELRDVQRAFGDPVADMRYRHRSRFMSEAEEKNFDSYYHLYPERLFARACAIDPEPELFMRWLEWARQDRSWKLAEEAAEAWKRACPKDSRPLLNLMDLAEKRGALKKALGCLEQAEGLAALNPEVRRARLRLLVATAKRHLEQRKAHLVDRDIEDLEALPQTQEGDRPAFLAALAWAVSVLRGDPESASGSLTQVAARMGSRVAAAMVVSAVADACELQNAVTERHCKLSGALDEKEPLAVAVARACALGDDLGWPLAVPPALEERLLDELRSAGHIMDARQLRLLAEAALRLNHRQLAFAASGAGLAKDGATQARFLLLRGRALPLYEPDRRDRCFAAAAELARRQRDMGLVDEAVDCRRGQPFMGRHDPFALGPSSMSTEELNRVLNHEKQSTEFPEFRAGKFESPFDDGPDFGDDEDDDDDDLDDDLGPVTPEEFAEMMDQLNEILGMGERKGSRPKRRRGRRGPSGSFGPPGPPRPPSGGGGQGSLF